MNISTIQPLVIYKIDFFARVIIANINIFLLTGAMTLVLQYSNLQEKWVLGPQNKKNQHLECTEGYLNQQLASIAYQSKEYGLMKEFKDYLSKNLKK